MSQPPQPTSIPAPNCDWEKLLMDAMPEYTPVSTEEFRKAMFELGATEETLDNYVKAFNRRAEIVRQRGGYQVIGRKPPPDDPNVYSVRIPESRYAIRMWDGGMGPYGQFCLDFWDIERRVSLNLPEGHSLHPAMMAVPAGLGPGYPPAGYPVPANHPSFGMGELRSWERNQNMAAIPDGEERWSIPEGAFVTLKRNGHPEFTFQMPRRQVVVAAQPQLGGL